MIYKCTVYQSPEGSHGPHRTYRTPSEGLKESICDHFCIWSLWSCRAIAGRKYVRAVNDNGLPKGVSLLNLKLVTLQVSRDFTGVIKSKFLRLVFMHHSVGMWNYKIEAGE